jgi:hypothetical protein
MRWACLRRHAFSDLELWEYDRGGSALTKPVPRAVMVWQGDWGKVFKWMRVTWRF